ncbi:MAG: glycosyltransferase family 9 protein [Candidatus Omnitrophica bacterium]|nr:glycosyltransferase family 9 protein [Candidatus Omnitrophota bacterium]
MRFLIINPFGIGDVLFTTPLARAIKRSADNVFLGYWCNIRVEEILRRNPHVDRIFAMSRGDLKKLSWPEGAAALLDLARGIRRERFDAAVDLSLDHRYALLCKLAGIRKRIGYDFKNRGRFLTDKFPLAGYKDKHVIEYYLDLLNKAGISRQGEHMELFTAPEDELRADDFLRTRNIKSGALIIGIAPAGGLSWGEKARLKYWPKEHFAGLADNLIKNMGAGVIFLGDKGDAGQISGIMSLMENRPVNAAGKVSLGSLSALLKRCGLLITNDGGILHMAVALGIKTVSLFGPTDERVYGPYPKSSRHIVISRETECRPCYNNFRIDECLNENECLRDIDVKDVYEAAERLLS